MLDSATPFQICSEPTILKQDRSEEFIAAARHMYLTFQISIETFEQFVGEALAGKVPSFGQHVTPPPAFAYDFTWSDHWNKLKVAADLSKIQKELIA